jgi:hypothetical protein
MLDVKAGDICNMQSNTGANVDGMGSELTKVVIVGDMVHSAHGLLESGMIFDSRINLTLPVAVPLVVYTARG